MATIRYFDVRSVVAKQSLLGETCYLVPTDLFDLPDDATAGIN
jgi:hypothetical protein